MAPRRYRCFFDVLSPDGNENEIARELSALDVRKREFIQRFIRHMEGNPSIPGKKWQRLEGKYNLLWELRFIEGQVQTRLLACKGPKVKELDSEITSYVFLSVATHKDDVYQPPDVLDTALRLRKEVLEKRRKLRAHDFR